MKPSVFAMLSLVLPFLLPILFYTVFQPINEHWTVRQFGCGCPSLDGSRHFICRSAPVWLLGLCVIALISGIIQFLADCNQLYTWRQRLAEAEAEGRDDGNG